MYKVIDFHCDLLAYLAVSGEVEAPLHACSACSIPLLEKGGVSIQTLALFTETGQGSFGCLSKQLQEFDKMVKNYSDRVEIFQSFQTSKVSFLLAVENLSGFLEEEESFKLLFKRFDGFVSQYGPPLYVSMTWNQENRFGGGNSTKIGLKDEGRAFLDYLDEKKIAIDLSHTSDHLAYDILDYLEKKRLTITPIASHSNFRVIKDAPRNLPDEIAKQIVLKGGVIGINFLRPFVGEQFKDFISHIEYGRELVGDKALCLGADFFGGLTTTLPAYLGALYQKCFENASCYGKFLSWLVEPFDRQFIQNIAYDNAREFIENLQLN